MHGCGGDEQTSSQRQGLDIADIIRVHGEALRRLYPLTTGQTAALRDIERCRTAVLGGHLDVCSHCGFSKPSYNSCRNLHCPKCQSLREAAWVESRVARTLPTHHFHSVFTLPAELRPLAKLHPPFVYKQLIDCASATLGRQVKQVVDDRAVLRVTSPGCGTGETDGWPTGRRGCRRQVNRSYLPKDVQDGIPLTPVL